MSSAAIVYRHSRATRVLHWVNALSVFVVLMSGLQIFNAHPLLHWGQFGADPDPALLTIGAQRAADGQLIGVLQVGQHTRINTTGVLGVSKNQSGRPTVRGFPRWATIPSTYDLASARHWHFFFAWV